MKFTLEATPLDIVYHTDVQIEVRCEVYDIHRQHATAIQALFAQHPFFEQMQLRLECDFFAISALCFTWSGFPGEISEVLADIERKVNEVLDKFADQSMGYHAIKA
jgi:hypothetical protein